ncbi:hypothetical protein EVAR_35351_1 [Eumeta japonica]|uniref:Uncharacterized protein n=1 Tax=Eumeta variegata TaxID=151549 RepID=A0A4C1XHN1_EUMVA|nr:hypothetical protein EVAR_35351_1 [Eumeta japonica]
MLSTSSPALFLATTNWRGLPQSGWTIEVICTFTYILPQWVGPALSLTLDLPESCSSHAVRPPTFRITNKSKRYPSPLATHWSHRCVDGCWERIGFLMEGDRVDERDEEEWPSETSLVLV